MKTRLLNSAHRVAMEQLTSPGATVVKLLSGVAEASCPTGEDFTCTIAKVFLAPSYHYNPSLLAKKIQGHAPSFSDASGHVTDDNDQVAITLYRQRRVREGGWKGRHKQTIKHSILEWIASSERSQPLHFPSEQVPPFLRTHPEQLTYQVYRETSQRIKIERLKTKWIIKMK